MVKDDAKKQKKKKHLKTCVIAKIQIVAVNKSSSPYFKMAVLNKL